MKQRLHKGSLPKNLFNGAVKKYRHKGNEIREGKKSRRVVQRLERELMYS